MSMHNKLKLFALLQQILCKCCYHNNLQLTINKEWLNCFKKLTYLQIYIVRKYSLSDGILKNFQEQNLKNIKQRKEKTVEKLVTNILTREKKNILPEKENSRSNDIQSSTVKQTYYIPQVLTTLMPKLSGKLREIPTVPKWKTNLKACLINNSIASRTQHILNSIVGAESNASKWRRIEDLIYHIEQFPEAKHFALKNGAIRILLLIQQSNKYEQMQESIREALAVLGYIKPLPARGIRILTIDGGGIRGILVIQMLKKLEQLTGQKIYEIFDYICGVSTGAILSVALGGHKKKSLDEISELYKKLSTKIFTQSLLRGTSKMVWSHAYYDTELWEKMLQENLGNRDLIKTTRDPISPKFSATSVIVNHKQVMVYVFRNYTIPNGLESQYMGSHKHKLWESVRASAAAPSYFEEFQCGKYLHQDGGIMANNPCAIAIHEAKQLWPNSPIQCVVSFGTGRTPFFVHPNSDNKIEAASSLKDKFYKILDSATDTEAVHIILNDLLPDHVYYRFNPYLTEMLTMVEIRPEKIAQLEQDAAMYIHRNEEKFQKAAKILMQKKTYRQKLLDWFKLQKIMIGI